MIHALEAVRWSTSFALSDTKEALVKMRNIIIDEDYPTLADIDVLDDVVHLLQHPDLIPEKVVLLAKAIVRYKAG